MVRQLGSLAAAAMLCISLWSSLWTKTASAQGADAGGALGRRLRAMASEPAVARAHWGVSVVSLDGRAISGMNDGQMFQPASNAKLFTTAIAMSVLGGDTRSTTQVVGRGAFSASGAELHGDLVLIGDGDANLSGRELPYRAPKQDLADTAKRVRVEVEPRPLRFLEEMADQVAATGLKAIDGDVVGDDTLFPWDPYPTDWAIDDAVWGYGAPVSALTVNDNQLAVTVLAGMKAGEEASVAVEPLVPAYYTVDQTGLTTGVAKSGTHVQMERTIGSRVLRVFGTIAVDSAPDVEEVAIEDPAEFGAMALKSMLEARGVRVIGRARAKHWRLNSGNGFLEDSNKAAERFRGAMNGLHETACSSKGETREEAELPHRVLATHRSAALKDDITVTNKVSQNLHAELLLLEMTRPFSCLNSRAEGAGIVRDVLRDRVGIDENDFVFFDGSGLSGHDLVTPRAMTRLLVWAAREGWFGDWRGSLPVGGEDGTLVGRFVVGRFVKGSLKGKVFAKTGTLGEARALSGYMVCASGRTVAFSVMVGNRSPGTDADREVMDRMVEAIAAAN